ncbi:phosphohydrolase [Thermodesulfobacteriota bacterium]
MKCPGQDMRYWKDDAIFEAQCPNCDAVIEFFKDETRRRCKKCRHKVLNPKMDFGCAAHCKFAEHCFGELPPELIKEKEDLFKDRVAVEMKLHFKTDFKRIAHAARVAAHAEKIVPNEKCDPAVVLSAAYLQDVDAAEGPGAGDSAGQGTSIAREILTKLDAHEELINEVCHIISTDPDGTEEKSLNFMVFHDAQLLAELKQQERKGTLDEGSLHETIENRFLTAGGAELARSIFLEDRQTEIAVNSN